MEIYGGYVNYGQDIGILMLDTVCPRLRGDIGNAATFPFPVRYKVVTGAFPARVVPEQDNSLLPHFIVAAQELEQAGVKAITTSCGFLAIYQSEMAACVKIPVFTSSLLQIPLIETMLAPGRSIAVVSANGQMLNERRLIDTFSISRIKHPVIGLEQAEEFYSVFVGQRTTLNLEKLTHEMTQAAEQVKLQAPQAGAIVLECTNLPPFRHIFQQVTGLPVFDIVSLTRLIAAGFFPACPGSPIGT
jgi:Asp/Glu/hydantoin racemase